MEPLQSFRESSHENRMEFFEHSVQNTPFQKLRNAVVLASGLVLAACGGTVETHDTGGAGSGGADTGGNGGSDVGGSPGEGGVAGIGGMGGSGGAGGIDGSGGTAGAGGGVEPCVHIETAATPTSQTVLAGSANVPFACWNLTNGCTNDQMLQSFGVHRYGAGSVDDFDSLRLYVGPIAISNLENFNSADERANFSNLNYIISQGATKTVCANANLNSNGMSGSQDGFEIVKSNDVTVQDQVYGSTQGVSGNFPVQGPVMMIANP